MRVALSHVFLPPLIELDVRSSRIQLSDHLLPAACAASQADGSLALPFVTTDSVCTGTDSSSVYEPTANCVDVCVGAIPATHSARPNRSDERYGCCCQPGNRYTTHSRPDSTSESPPRPTRYSGMIALPRAPDPGYVGTPSCAATCTATVSGVSETRNQETQSPLPPWSNGSSPGSPPIVEPRTGFGDAPKFRLRLVHTQPPSSIGGVAPTGPAKLAPSAAAANRHGLISRALC